MKKFFHFPAAASILDRPGTGSVFVEENGRLKGMLRKLLGKVEDGRFSRALAGLQASWQFEVGIRVFGKSGVKIGGHVRYGSKKYTVHIKSGSVYTCTCEDYMRREVICKHIAFVAMAELAHYAAERSAHRQVQEARPIV
ncbi:SWIM zinc finger family protein [Desulforamulus aquiferis]|uniref:SWIM zinc finger domain-containing protein n=1 Tax=Desulforamulus aquiferis TaxID=1397668 RepID=A0AAW7ZF04_9FIRM|nr:SWIM zinc finger family protein [Desulforamulus aquiferis]MDO7787869.1 SWIM zinc finger domain-containing protein [Desulforamulus aquiferis]